MPTFNVIQGCATIQLTQGRNALVDAADYPWLSLHSWYAKSNRSGPYAIRWDVRRKGCEHRMHIAILEAMSGPVPPGMYTDHRNSDTLDNRRANLRPATPSQNRSNARKRTPHGRATSRFKGVSWDATKRKWRAYIEKDGRYHLGYFASEVEAARAYNQAARELHGEFARLNEGVD